MSEEKRDPAPDIVESLPAKKRHREFLIGGPEVRRQELLRREATGLPQLGRYIFRSFVVLAVGIVFAAFATNLGAILDRIDWHYVLLAGVFAVLFLPGADGESD